jgi:hypothetical protein
VVGTASTSPHLTSRNEKKRKITYPFREQPVTRTKAATVAETHTSARDARLVVDDNIFLVVADEILEPLHQFMVSADEGARAMNEDCAIDEILAEKVAELEEFVESVLVADGFLSAIEEAQLVACRGGRCSRWDWRGKSGDESRRCRRLIVLLRHVVDLFRALCLMLVLVVGGVVSGTCKAQAHAVRWLGKAKTSHVCYNTILRENTYFATRTGVGSLAIYGRRNTIRSAASSALSFASLALVVLHHWCGREVADRR